MNIICLLKTSNQLYNELNLHTFDNKETNLNKYMFITPNLSLNEITIKDIIIEYYTKDKNTGYDIIHEIPLNYKNITSNINDYNLSAEYILVPISSVIKDTYNKKIKDICFSNENILILSLEFFNILQNELSFFRLKIYLNNKIYLLSNCFRVYNTIVENKNIFNDNIKDIEYILEIINNDNTIGFINKLDILFKERLSLLKKKLVFSLLSLLVSLIVLFYFLRFI